MIVIGRDIVIADDDIEERFVRSSGPGGQNVNKVSSAVELRFHFAQCASLPWRVRDQLPALAGRRLNKDGVLVIQAERFRSQDRNRQDAMDRLIALLCAANEPPPMPRRITRIPKSAQRTRLADKKQASGRKALRRRPDGED